MFLLRNKKQISLNYRQLSRAEMRSSVCSAQQKINGSSYYTNHMKKKKDERQISCFEIAINITGLASMFSFFKKTQLSHNFA